MDKSLDDVVRERQSQRRGVDRNRRGPSGGNQRGIRKPDHRSSTRNGSSEKDRGAWGVAWVHDRYDEDYDMGVVSRETTRKHSGYSGGRREGREGREGREETKLPPGAARLRIENLHYELGQEDLSSLFNRIAPTLSVTLKYDRAGRSEGVAFVTYERESHARKAIQEFDGANAHGQPIYITLISSPSSNNPNAGKSLFERVERPRSLSPIDNNRERIRPSGRGSKIDRYVPADRDDRGRDREKNRRDAPIIERGRDGRRRRERGRRGDGGGGAGGGNGGSGGGNSGGGGGGGEGRSGGNIRPKKTLEELDEEMSNYWNGAETTHANSDAGNAMEPRGEQEEMTHQNGGRIGAHQEVNEDDMMIE